MYYGDGSGGRYSSYPTIRRCGVGICCMSEPNIMEFGVRYQLPGEVQTVPRAEVSAMATVAQMAMHNAYIIYIGDNQQVISMYLKGKTKATSSTNADLY